MVFMRCVITIRTGVGSNPLHGLLICGQFDTSTSVSVSARTVSDLPGADRPSTMPRVPSASTGTFMKKLMLDTMSRLPMPHLAASARKFSAQAC